MNYRQRLSNVKSSPVGKVGIYSLLGQIVLAISLPVTARLYGAYAVGVFATVLTLSQVGTVIATGRIEQVLPRLVAGRRWLVGRGVLILAGAASICLGPIISWQSSASGRALVLSAVGLVFALASYAVSNMFMLAYQDFTGVARLRLINAVVTAILQILGGLVSASPAVLVATYALGNLLAAGLAVPLVWTNRMVADIGFKQVVRDEGLVQFALSVGTSALLTSMSLALPMVGLAHVYGADVAASYFLVRRFLAVPTQIVASTVNEVSYSLLARNSISEIEAYMKRWLRRLVWGAMAIVCASLVAAYPVQLLLGDEFVATGLVTVVQSPAAAAQLLGTSLSNLLLVLHAEHIRLWVNLGRFVALAATMGLIVLIAPNYVMGVGLLAAVTVVGLLSLLVATLLVVGRRAGHVPAS